MLQMKLDRSLPFGPVFHGAGETNADDKECRFYQHGLYFGAKDELLIDHPYNKQKVDTIRKLGGINPDKPAEEVVTQPQVLANPEVVAALDAKTDAELFAMATKLVSINAENGVLDEFEPQESDRDGNLRFIAKYTG